MIEGKVKVKVKFGKTIYWSLGAPNAATLAASAAVRAEAIDRLLTAFPQVENIETETKVSYCTNPEGMGKMGVKASAFGYVPKGKNSTRHIIKDIKTTKLYQVIAKELEEANVTVVGYAFRYMKKHRHKHYVEFCGKGNIPWEQLRDAINIHNQDELNSGAPKKDLLIINPNELYIDQMLVKGRWKGNILLLDGSWLEIKDSYSSFDQGFYTGIERHHPPKLDIPDSNFELRISSKDNLEFVPCFFL